MTRLTVFTRRRTDERNDASSSTPHGRRLAVATGALASASIAVVGLPPRATSTPVGPTSKPVITVSAQRSPARLPRSRMAPAKLRLGFTSTSPGAATVPGLEGIRFELARELEIRTSGLPSCPITELYHGSSDAAVTCAASLVGRGSVTSEVTLPGRAPVTVEGTLLAFYDLGEGQPRILAQIVGGPAMPLTYVIPFTIYRETGGFPTSLSASRMRFIDGICARGRPNCFSQAYAYEGIYGHISRFELTLARRFMHARRKVSFVNADCPAPRRSKSAVLPLVNVNLAYQALFRSPSQLVTSRCEVAPQRHRRRKR